MQDRIPLYPGRVQLIPVDGQENTFDLVRADQATQEGTPLNKGSLLKDTTAAMFDFPADQIPDIVPDDAFSAISGRVLAETTMDDTTYVELALPKIADMDPLKRYCIELFPGDSGLSYALMSFYLYADGSYREAGSGRLELSCGLSNASGAKFRMFQTSTGSRTLYSFDFATGNVTTSTSSSNQVSYMLPCKNIIRIVPLGGTYGLFVLSTTGIHMITAIGNPSYETIVRFAANSSTSGVKIRLIEGANL